MRLKKLAERESGYALPLAMVSVLIFSLFITVYMGLLTHELKVNRKLITTWQARYVAESGVENALFNIKKHIQNGGSAYSLNLSSAQFGSDENFLLPPNSKGITLSNYKSSADGTLYSAGGSRIGDYTWVIKYDHTEPGTPASPQPGYLYNYLEIQSVGTTVDGGVFRVDANIRVMFQPIMVPESPIKIEYISYKEVPVKFAWE